jgi:hypothetical protein
LVALVVVTALVPTRMHRNANGHHPARGEEDGSPAK